MKTVRYSDSLKAGEFSFEIAFTGSGEVGMSNLTNTGTSLRCYDSLSEVLWERSLGDVTMPDGAWNGFKLLAALKNRVFAAFGNRLAEIDIATGNSKWEIKTGNTFVRTILAAEDRIVVLNGYYKFHHPAGGNLSAYDALGCEIWRCAIGDDVFTDFFKSDVAGKLRVGTWNGFTCIIDGASGEILSRDFTK